MNDFRDRVVVVTGSGPGIGREIARRFADKGASVVITGTRPNTVDAAAELAAQTDADVSGLVCDVSDEASVAAFCDALRSRHVAVHIVINNTAITPRGPLFLASDDATGLTGQCVNASGGLVML